MPEYIERENLLRQMRDSKVDKPTYGNWNLAHDCCIDIAEKIPTADVAEVEHGEWKRCEDYEIYWYECSNCGGEPLRNPMSNADFLSDYCPHCGAKMDGKDKKYGYL